MFLASAQTRGMQSPPENIQNGELVLEVRAANGSFQKHNFKNPEWNEITHHPSQNEILKYLLRMTFRPWLFYVHYAGH